MSSRNRTVAGAAAAALVIAAVVAVAACGVSKEASRRNDAGATQIGPGTTKSGSGAATTAPGATTAGSGATAATGPTIPIEQRGVLEADHSPQLGQAPSSGTCARWSERFVNNSRVTVVHVTFPVASAHYSRGKPGTPDYREYPAATPVPSQLNVHIAPNASQAIQFMSCTTTAPPAGADALDIAPPTHMRWTWVDGAESNGRFP